MSDPLVELDPTTVGIGVAFGLMRWDSEGQFYELTPKGDEYIRGWMKEKLAEQANQTEGA